MATKNTAEDLNNHLFAQLERLGDEGITPKQLEQEIKRAEAITLVAGKLIDMAKVKVGYLNVIGQDGRDKFFEGKQLNP